MNPTANKRAGAKYETDLVEYLRMRDGLDVERLRLTGREDEGDILLRLPPALTGRYPLTPWGEDRRWVLEAKREKGFSLATWVKEAQVERLNYAKHRGIAPPAFAVVHHARGKAIGQGYVTTTLDEFLSWL